VLGEAAYIAFRGARRVTPLFTARADRDEVLAAARRTLIETIDRIERGEFPPTPDDVFLCGFCPYASVCRKDYVGDV
jgi:CRISPR/Cas system-associated exonuclease Cas4 (RecB family)